MKYIFCFTILLLTYHHTIAQDNIRELLSDIRNAPNDSVRVEHYKTIFDEYQFSKPDSATYYLNDGIRYFTKSGYKRGIAMLTSCLGQQEGLQGKAESAKEKYRAALAIYKEIGNRSGIASVNNSLGVVEGRAGNYLGATKYFMTALREYEKDNNTKGIINTYLKLGNVSDIGNNPEKALEYFNKGLALSLKIPGDRNTAYLYNSIGVVYCKTGKVDTGLALFGKAYQLSGGPGMTETRILTLMHIGNAYKEKGDNNKSLEYYNKALSETSPDNMPENYARIVLNIAVIKGFTDHREALSLLKTAGDIATTIGHRNLKLEVMEEMIRQYQLLGDYKSAFAILEQSKVLQDSLFNIEKNTEIANLMSKHELERSNARVQELEAAERKTNLQRNIIIIIAVVFAITLVLLTVTYHKTKGLNKSLRSSEAELQRSSAIKDRIFSIIGHDLRGPIANIPMVIELYQDPRTSEDEKTYMLDLLIENSMASLETLDKLLHWGKSQIKGTAIQQRSFRASQNLQHQVSLIKGIAANKAINIQNNVPADTTVFADEDHFNFVIRNLLSNAIKYSHRDSDIVIEADRYSERGFTVFSVKDTGVGIDKEKISKVFEAFNSSTLGTNNESGTSIGLMLCKEFVNENGGKIWIESEPGKGTTFYFTLKNA